MNKTSQSITIELDWKFIVAAVALLWFFVISAHVSLSIEIWLRDFGFSRSSARLLGPAFGVSGVMSGVMSALIALAYGADRILSRLRRDVTH